ncbi:unnamed protein product [Lampetra fluviatilis]
MLCLKQQSPGRAHDEEESAASAQLAYHGREASLRGRHADTVETPPARTQPPILGTVQSPDVLGAADPRRTRGPEKEPPDAGDGAAHGSRGMVRKSHGDSVTRQATTGSRATKRTPGGRGGRQETREGSSTDRKGR